MSAEEAEGFQPFNASQIVGKDMALLKQVPQSPEPLQNPEPPRPFEAPLKP